MYVAASAHEDDDFSPYVFRSTDLGRTWTSIVSDLPPGAPVFALVEDPARSGLLVAGTEVGVYATLDDGRRWMSLQRNLPTSPIHDIVIHPRERDLIVGTHGRGIWIMDSIRGLEGLTPEVAAADAAIFAPRPALQMTRFDRGRNALGQTYYTAPNPPEGALIDYYVNPRITAPVTLEIFDAAGARVRALDLGPRGEIRGLRRVVWDMRAEPAAAGQGRGGGRGTLAPVGTYEARLTVGTEVYRAEVVLRGGLFPAPSD
jgi:hypothetical protein